MIANGIMGLKVDGIVDVSRSIDEMAQVTNGRVTLSAHFPCQTLLSIMIAIWKWPSILS